RYMPNQPRRKQSSQGWMTFVRNHAKSIIACDFLVVVTATFRLVYVFIVMEIGTRRILHLNVTKHPNAEWTMLQFRECLTGEERYRFVIHDRDAIYSKDVDLVLKTTGLQILQTPAQSPQANTSLSRNTQMRPSLTRRAPRAPHPGVRHRNSICVCPCARFCPRRMGTNRTCRNPGYRD